MGPGAQTRALPMTRVHAMSASGRTSPGIISTISSVRSARDFNFAKRDELADLRGRVALVTGGRVKIGYQAGLKLLRCGRAP